MNPKEMREERGRLFEQAKKINEKALAEKRQMSAEESAQWKAINADIDRMGADIERADRLAAIEGSFAPGREDTNGKTDAERAARETENHGTATAQDTDLSLRAWMRTQFDRSPSQDEVRAAKRTGTDLRAREFEIRLPSGRIEARDLSATTAGSGGATVPEGFVNQLERSMLYFGPMRQVATTLRTASGAPLPYPTVNDTGNTGTILAENTTIGSSVDPSFGSITFGAYKYSSKLCLVPVELMEDSAFDVASMLASMLGERLGRVTNTAFTTGSGSAPNGIVTASNAATLSTGDATTASATAIAADEIIDLVHAVDVAYRSLPGAGFMANDAVWREVRKLKDGAGNYLWQPGYQMGQADRLLGYPVWTNNAMATIAAEAKVMVFGALSKYVIREVGGIRIRRLVERYADTDQEGFVAFLRTDGDLLDAGTDPVKHLAMHA